MDVVDNTLTAASAAATPHATLYERVIPHVVFQGTDEARHSAEMWRVGSLTSFQSPLRCESLVFYRYSHPYKQDRCCVRAQSGRRSQLPRG
ncbi:hypothetical protein BD311DRAFT_768699 [Dichomitus squalens]|uniref:Uncharacterized protein n=1 Tax=Dichomitus squalens TaxID=114155 RepID=A0A4Q9MC59_9APHY|nr:hypothetical protein BD311DRAFT_768699 [Dichomitus squalens]